MKDNYRSLQSSTNKGQLGQVQIMEVHRQDNGDTDGKIEANKIDDSVPVVGNGGGLLPTTGECNFYLRDFRPPLFLTILIRNVMFQMQKKVIY